MALITGSFLIGAILIFLLVIFIGYGAFGALASLSLNMIPAPFWILLGIILFVLILGGGKRK